MKLREKEREIEQTDSCIFTRGRDYEVAMESWKKRLFLLGEEVGTFSIDEEPLCFGGFLKRQFLVQHHTVFICHKRHVVDSNRRGISMAIRLGI